MILEGRNLTGTTVINGNLWLADCRAQDASIIVRGDLYVERPSVFEKVALAVSGDIVFRPPTVVVGEVKAHLLAAHNELTVEGRTEADTVLTIGECYFKELKTRAATFNGTVTAEAIEADAITVDGDIIAERVCANTLLCERGSVLVRDLMNTRVTALMIANFGDQRLDTQRHKFQWARPVIDLKSMSIPDMVAGGVAALQHHAPGLPPIHIERLQKIQQCSDVGDLYVALYEDMKAMYNALTPAAQQFVDGVEQHGFPGNYWRF